MQHVVRRTEARGRLRRSRHERLLLVVAMVMGTLAIAPASAPASPSALDAASASVRPPAPAASPASTAAVGDLGFFTSAIAQPQSIVAGPDGNLWFTDMDYGRISRITPDGNVTTFPEAPDAPTFEITAGLDGNLWFTSTAANHTIWRITPSGVVTAFSDSTIDPYRISAGPDGNVWFTNGGGGAGRDTIGRITPAGVVTVFADPALEWGGRAIAPGPDGNVWFTVGSGSDSAIGRITPTGDVTTFTDPGIVSPVDIVTGPDGNVWFTNGGAVGSVGRISPAGAVTTFTDPALTWLGAITSGADGKVWFTIGGGQRRIAAMTPDGVITTFDDPQDVSIPDMTSGPDGNVWFTYGGLPPGHPRGAIGRITPGGGVTLFSDPSISRARGITAGPDGNVWYANAGEPSIGRMSPSGVADVFTDPAVDEPDGITAGPDGNLWFTNRGVVDSVGRVTPSGEVTTFPDPQISEPRAITAGPDGNLWFVNAGSASIGRITPTGSVTVFTDPAIHNPFDITSGPDGNLWFINNSGNSLGRITPSGSVAVLTDPKLASLRGITAGPGGAIWFSTYDFVGRVTLDGTVTRFLVNDDPFAGAFGASTNVRGIAAGRDGNLWIVLTKFWDVSELVRVTPSGVITRFPHMSIALAMDLAVGPDDQVWFTNSQGLMIDDQARAIGHVWTGERPGSPGAPVAVAGVTSATVSWTPPAATGSDPVTGYTVTAVEDPSRSCTWSAGPLTCTVSGLEADVAYRFTVTATNAVGTSEVSPPSDPVVPTGPPQAPTAPVAVSGVFAASVSWLPPAQTGGSPVTGYTVEAVEDPSRTCTWSSGPLTCTVSGLEAGVSYRFTVRATNGLGTSPPSAPSDPVVPAGPPGSPFHPVTPFRLWDSRTGPGPVGAVRVGAPVTVPVGGLDGVPDDAVAVVLNVTVTGGTAPTALTVGPAGGLGARPPQLFAAPGQTVANLVTVDLGAGPGSGVDFVVGAGSIDVVADVFGYYDAAGELTGDRFNPTAPVRLLDSRGSVGGWSSAPLGAGEARLLEVAGRAGVPASATGVVMNVTVTEGSDASYLRMSPAGGTPAPTANLLWAPGQTVTNLVTVGLGAGGAIVVENQRGDVHVVADVVGYFDPATGSLFHPVVPARALDSRTEPPLGGSPLGAGASRTLVVDAVPWWATAVAANVTATQSTAASYLAVTPTGTPAPPAIATLLFGPGETRADAVMVGLGAGRDIDVYNQQGLTHAVIDVAGYYAPW